MTLSSKLLRFLPVLLLVAGQAAAHGHHRHLLQGRSADAKSKSNKHRSDGKKFDFTAEEGGAPGYLRRMDQAKLKRTIEISGWTKGEDKLADLLNLDADLGIDSVNGGLIYSCEGMATVSGRSEIASGVDPNQVDPSYLQAFNLASRPASTKKIWLDFKGCFVKGTAWNTNGNNFTVPPYDKDGNSAAFSASEMSDIVAVWRAVSEDYAPFDVDVTTIPPSSSINMQYVSHVCIGGDGSGPGYASSGGVAYVGVFGQSWNAQYQPAFVFPKNLGPGALSRRADEGAGGGAGA
eukprot:GHRQ01017190.1.p1 GENE.GHRQ01017190.1~~GHRQ01017190.1.p1  ORF type:complete len:292 (+),score=46.43 GHRQ01017190.1:120-995(+)